MRSSSSLVPVCVAVDLTGSRHRVGTGGHSGTLASPAPAPCCPMARWHKQCSDCPQPPAPALLTVHMHKWSQGMFQSRRPDHQSGCDPELEDLDLSEATYGLLQAMGI